MYDFQYLRPATIDEAARLLATRPDAKLMSGGMSLLPAMKQRLARWSAIIDLGGVPGLDDIRMQHGALVVGARARHVSVLSSSVVRAAIPALAELAEGIGDPLVRNRGAIGGSVANADPAADYPAALLGLGATVVTNQREIAADDFFTGLFETALEAGEIITAVRFPPPKRAAYAKYRHPASRYAVVGAFVAETTQGVRVAVTGAASHVFRVPAFEDALSNSLSLDALVGVTPAYGDLNADLFASSEYRAHVIGEMVRRAVQACLHPTTSSRNA